MYGVNTRYLRSLSFLRAFETVVIVPYISTRPVRVFNAAASRDYERSTTQCLVYVTCNVGACSPVELHGGMAYIVIVLCLHIVYTMPVRYSYGFINVVILNITAQLFYRTANLCTHSAIHT